MLELDFKWCNLCNFPMIPECYFVNIMIPEVLRAQQRLPRRCRDYSQPCPGLFLHTLIHKHALLPLYTEMYIQQINEVSWY